MNYPYTPESRWYRFFEMVPGMLIWGTFFAAVILSVARPLWVIFFIIIFDLYWLFRVIYFVIFLLYAWGKYQKALTIPWLSVLKKDHKDWKGMYHLIFLPIYKEGMEIVEPTLQSLLHANYPQDRMIVVLAGEERASEHFKKIAATVQKKYKNAFFKLLITTHPANIPGELASKGANINYAGHAAQKLIDQLHIPYEKVIVSAFDIDTIPHPEYFACLTDAYLSHPNPTRSSFQPLVLYNNNIWESPAPMRLAAFSTTFWLMAELVRPDRLFTFSSHSMSFKALVDVGFWQNNIVSEDSRIFLQCFMHYNGEYSVTPLYIPVSMDTVMAGSIWNSLVNLYKQQRRWAWGVEHFPYMIAHFWRNATIPLGKRLKFLWIQAEGMYMWAVASLMIFFLGRVPLWFVQGHDRGSLFTYNAPFILETLLNCTLIGAFVIAILSLRLLPKRPKGVGGYRYIYMVLQWLLLPLSLILFSSLPAIDAQTRMLLGKYLGFWVTEKERKSVSVPSKKA